MEKDIERFCNLLINLASTLNEYRDLFKYHNRNQLTQANYNYYDGSSWVNVNTFDVTGLSYDKDGNITALNRRLNCLNTYSYTYASGTNRLATVNKNGSNISFGYDGNGSVCPPTGVITTIGTGYSITNTVYELLYHIHHLKHRQVHRNDYRSNNKANDNNHCRFQEGG